MSKTIVSHATTSPLSASTEPEGLTAYQLAVTRFDSWSNLGEIRKFAAKQGWNAAKFMQDVWSELYDPNFKVWEVQA